MSSRYNFKVGTKVIVNGHHNGKVFNNSVGVVRHSDVWSTILIKFPRFSWYFGTSLDHEEQYNFTMKAIIDDRKEFTDEEYEALLI